MVRPVKVGKQRSFARGLGLSALTFTIYGFYWNFKAHHELYRQFDVEDEGRDEGMVWFILGIVLFRPLYWVYQAIFINNVNYLRQRLGLGRGVSVPLFLTLIILGGAAVLIGAVVGNVQLVAGADDLEDPNEPGLTDEEQQARLERQLAAYGRLLSWVGAGFAVWAVLAAVAYYHLQRSINEVWDAYDRRMAQLAPPTPPPASAPFVPAPASPVQGPRAPMARPR